MKKLTILLVIVMFIALGIRGSIESKKEVEPAQENFSAVPNPNTQLKSYMGTKVRGIKVKALFSLVETLNEQEVFPINIRYGDVLPNSYNWVVKTTENLNSGDSIRESAYFEVVMQDQLPEGKLDGYLDTITIRAYQQPNTTNSFSFSGE